jgi:hypothetical protein
MKPLVWCLAMLVAPLHAAAEPPALVWWSAPVAPGEIVLTHGGSWGEKPLVEVVPLANGEPGMPGAAAAPDFAKAERVTPLKVTETGVSFELSRSTPPGLVACRIVSEDHRASRTFVLNEPDAWWLHGDRGATASPGGWLRVFGRCLSSDGRASLVLVQGDRRIELPLSKKDVWSLDAAVPETLPPGAYEVYLHNGCGGKDGWRLAGRMEIQPQLEVWKTDRFNVADYGAVPNDGIDDTSAIRAALAAAEKNGGGIVYLPRGRFQCNDTLQIPVRTLLRGQSRETTQLYWPDCEEPPEALIEGVRAFGIEDLFIHSGKYRNGIICKSPTAELKDPAAGSDVTIRRVRLKLLIDQYLLKNTAEYEKRAYLPGNGLVISGGRFVRVEDCDLYASKEGSNTLFFILSAEYLRVANCRINGSGWAVVGGDKVLFENNTAYNCTYSISSLCRNLYWGGNRQYDLFTNNRESITHDGSCTAFRGLVAARCEGTRLDLDLDVGKNPYRRGESFWVGKSVQIVEGRGAGQFRTVTALKGNTVTIDRPWDLAPDASSRFVVTAMRQRLLYLDNDTEDSSIAIQLYGGLTEGVLARNRCARSGGFVGFGMDYGGIIPLWYVQFLDNRILEGNAYRGPQNEVPPKDSVMEIRDLGGSRALTRSCLIRRGILDSNARLGMTSANGLVENCVVRNSDAGIIVGGQTPEATILRGNRFENVVSPLNQVAQEKALMHPAEQALAMICGSAAVLGDRAPADWQAIQAELETCSRTCGITDPKAASQARAGLLRAIRALAACGDKTCDEKAVQSLLGSSVGFPPWNAGLIRLFSSQKEEKCQVGLMASLSALAPEAQCAVAFEPCPGWTFESAFVRLAPATSGSINVSITAPEGPKGFFRFPATVTYTGDGWTLKTRVRLNTLTENRICHWVVAGPFECASDQPGWSPVPEGPIDLAAQYDTRRGKQGWQVLTTPDVHGAMPLDAFFGPEASREASAAVAVAVLHAKREMPVRFGFSGTARLLVDGRRVGTDMQRGVWGSMTLAPGDHVLKIVTLSKKNSPWSFRVWIDAPSASAPDDLGVVPPEAVLKMGTLPAAEHP